MNVFGARRRSTHSALIVVVLLSACGKKGPPLPPLVKLPVAPENLTASRRGNTIDVQFTVPATNTDGTRPANVARAEVYAITAPREIVAPMTDAQLLKLATKIGSVPVKAPRDPDATADADDPADEVDAPEGPGLEQGSVAHVDEPLSDKVMAPAQISTDPDARDFRAAADAERPLLGPFANGPTRIYAAVGASTRGRKGPVSKRIVVPLVPPPPPPSAAKMTYDAAAVTIAWPAIGSTSGAAPTNEGASAGVLPSQPIGAPRPAITYNVYDVTSPDAPARLTAAPIAEAHFADARITWGAKRCYEVRSAETIGEFTIESDASPAVCDVLVDTFAPAAPKGLTGIASEAAINLIWDPNGEPDLAGYVVLRALGRSDDLQPITPAPIQETRFKDTVESGAQYTYVVKAIDRAGNASPSSARITETAR